MARNARLVSRAHPSARSGVGLRSLRTRDRQGRLDHRRRDVEAYRRQDGAADRRQGADAAARLPRRRSLALRRGGERGPDPDCRRQGGRTSLRRDEDRPAWLRARARVRNGGRQAPLAPARDDQARPRAGLFLPRQPRLREGTSRRGSRCAREGARALGLVPLSRRERRKRRAPRAAHQFLSACRRESGERGRGRDPGLSQLRPRLEKRLHRLGRAQGRGRVHRGGRRSRRTCRQENPGARLDHLAQRTDDRGHPSRADRGSRRCLERGHVRRPSQQEPGPAGALWAMVDIAASFSPVTGGFMQVLAEISAPSNWTALQNLFAAVLVLIVLGAIGTFLLGKVLRKDEEQSRIDAEQIAVMIAGKMVARSPEDGDRLSLKERNSIKALIGEAVVALREHTGWTGRRAIEKLKAGDTALAIDLFAERAEEKRRVAGKAAREASAALRHQAALTLPDDARAALALFQQAFELDPHDAENLLGLAVVQFRLGDIPSVEGLIGEARSLAQGSREDIIGLIDMFAGVLNVRSGKLEAAIEKFENAKRIFEAVD